MRTRSATRSIAKSAVDAACEEERAAIAEAFRPREVAAVQTLWMALKTPKVANVALEAIQQEKQEATGQLFEPISFPALNGIDVWANHMRGLGLLDETN